MALVGRGPAVRTMEVVLATLPERPVVSIVDWQSVDDHDVVIPWCGPLEPPFDAWLAQRFPVAAWMLDRRNLHDLPLPFPPTRVGRAGEVFDQPVFVRSFWRHEPSRVHQGVLVDDALVQPVLPSATEEGQVSVVLAAGEIVQAWRAVPILGGPPVLQPMALFMGEDRLAKKVVSTVRARFDAELDRVAPPFVRVDLLRWEGALVVSDVTLIGPAPLEPLAATSVASAYLR